VLCGACNSKSFSPYYSLSFIVILTNLISSLLHLINLAKLYTRISFLDNDFCGGKVGLMAFILFKCSVLLTLCLSVFSNKKLDRNTNSTSVKVPSRECLQFWSCVNHLELVLFCMGTATIVICTSTISPTLNCIGSVSENLVA